MKYIILAIHIQLWILGSFEDAEESPPRRGIATEIAAAVDNIDKNVFPLTTLLNDQCVEPPSVCPNSNITFWLYTRSKPDTGINLSQLKENQFERPDSQLPHPWKVIIHGYTKSKDETPNPQLRREYFKKGKYNLISVDYAPLARNKCYLAAVHNVPLIAKCTAKTVENFFANEKIPIKSLHVIGFSMGAQIAGQIHKYLSNNKKPGRVTGLDPASPLFDGVVNDKIGTDAGDFVDIIHTNALLNGKREKLGHADFYVNGGFSQPGCSGRDNQTTASCNHNRAPLYYAESINSDLGFWGVPCDGKKFFTVGCSALETESVLMGEYTPLTTRGIYYLETSKESPFALGRTFDTNKRKITTGGLF